MAGMFPSSKIDRARISKLPRTQRTQREDLRPSPKLPNLIRIKKTRPLKIPTTKKNECLKFKIPLLVGKINH